MTFRRLYERQDKVLKKIFNNEESISPGVQLILCGGTALARCYLQHRASYDLVFFVGARFDPLMLQRRLSSVGVPLKMIEIVNDPMFAVQLHGMADVDGEPLRVSIVEDIYTGMFPLRNAGAIRTETVEGLYHRKLRTISGAGGGVISPTGRTVHAGARETARDLFDLYVLSREVKPLMEFVRDINEHGAAVPEALLISGLGKVCWTDLMDEFEMIEKAEKYAEVKAFDIKRYFDEVLR